ncbi:MAG: 2-succinyl-5-enolpyruvyl-6-hydroxy-3-cyclohexene-1-carboxylic-acid synthase [Verrucomicrobiales bacterium]|nr:2-succinyl-5-enolpyruvyl-6-hydroxy-3-cyclohexene-1-carboxylic-acid synthase [Verrucomicrobiales bacterium]
MSSGNATLAGTVINTATELGVRHFVICAGARNVPLIADLTTRDGLQLWNHFDERAAAFFALGLSKSKAEPVAIVTTSGTAVAELLPATIEAWYSGIPLVLISADRPMRFRGSGAPQAIEQTGIFNGYVSQSLDLKFDNIHSQILTGDQKSPIHLNVCFEEPVPEPPEITATSLKITHPEESESPGNVFPIENPIAIIGELPVEQRALVREFLITTQIPAWFEATSGLREDPALAEKRFESESEIPHFTPTEVIRIGGVPSLRLWRDLEESKNIRVINFTPSGFSGLARKDSVTTHRFSELPDFTNEPSTNVEQVFNLFAKPMSPGPAPHDPKLYRVQSQTVQGTISEKLNHHPSSEPHLIRKLSEIIPSSAAVFLGNSLPIREWNLAATHETPHPNCFANRGANGIDGEVSTFLGISANFDESWGIFGDLTALYDLNAPWILDQLPSGKRRIVVLNNGGGRIFSRLPAMKNLSSEAMRQTENHHQTRFSAWAALWNVEYLSWDSDFTRWSRPETDHAIIEIQIDQSASETFWSDLQS